jgi:uncharacterized membrane protein
MNNAATTKSFLKTVHRYWLAFAKGLAIVQTFLILFVLYWVPFALTAVFSRIFSRDLLQKKNREQPSFWLDRDDVSSPTVENLRRQF